MADKAECPACGAYLSEVAFAFARGQPCPRCGLPFDAVVMVTEAAARGADRELVDRVARAEARAARAEAEVGRLREVLQRVRDEVSEA